MSASRITDNSKPSAAGIAPPRALDHVVLPVTGLAQARTRLTALGFTVAPDAIHPFGTENCCVFLPDGTYLEPLGIDKRETCELAAKTGNVFVARDQAYRFRRGEDGFSALAFASPDATADHKRFVRDGISAGKMLEFSRVFDDGRGGRRELGFRLAFAADLRAPDALFFTCERVDHVAGDRGALARHRNGVVSIREIAMSEVNPSDFQYLLEPVVGTRDVNAHSFGIELAAANCNIACYSAAGLKAWYGTDNGGHGRGIRLRAILFGIRNLERTRALLSERGIAFDELPGRLVVQPAPGQGAIFAFEKEGRR